MWSEHASPALGNTDNKYIGDKIFYTGDALFVDGIGGFASVFATASFA